jgi:hypothetical protein
LKITNYNTTELLNFTNCYNLESLNFDFAISKYGKFSTIINGYFRKIKNLFLPKIFKEYYEEDYPLISQNRRRRRLDNSSGGSYNHSTSSNDSGNNNLQIMQEEIDGSALAGDI